MGGRRATFQGCVEGQNERTLRDRGPDESERKGEGGRHQEGARHEKEGGRVRWLGVGGGKRIGEPEGGGKQMKTGLH